MLPIELTATAAATLFAQAAIQEIGGQVGQGAWEGMSRLIRIIREKLGGESLGQEALDQVETAPDDQRKVEALAAVLQSHAAESPSFHRELAGLVAEAQHEPSLGRFVTEISGNARVGKLTNIDTVHGDVSF
jgi:vacuolar-type H+-ATPase catalytic subunit A/Vma1